jgi:carboxypeptidase Q
MRVIGSNRRALHGVLGLTALLACSEGCASSRHAETAPATPAEARAAQPAAQPAAEAMVVINGKFEPAPRLPMGDPATIARIVDEGKNRNQVMQHLTYLCTEIGPRLTGSSNQERASRWTAEKFREFGLTNVEVWKWGEIATRFDRGPSTGKVVAARTSGSGDEAKTTYTSLRDLQFSTPAWTIGTQGPVRGPVVSMPRTEEEYDAVKDRLKGSWVLIRRQPSDARPGVRGARGGGGVRADQRDDARKKVAEGANPASLPIEQRILFAGVNGFVSPSRDDRVWTGGAPGWRTRTPEQYPPDIDISIRASDYDFINSRLADGEPIELEFDLPHTLTAGPIPVYNTIAEIRGTTWPDEVVIVSAHLDSWNGPGSQGTTDNGTGAMVTLEAARILAAAEARPKRTIRFIHWSGEEQGLLGSRAYVAHLKEKGELDKISAVFVDDGGTNYEGGLKCTPAMVPMLAAATAPVTAAFPDMPVNIQPSDRLLRSIGGGSSDHASFLAEGVPGFFWDEVGRADYGFGWHTQNDRIDLAIPEYLVQSSTCAAITAYNLACADTLLPRENVVEKKDDGKQASAPGN